MKRGAPIEERFWSKVAKGSDTDCWEWTGRLHATGGYAVFWTGTRRDGHHRIASRFIYEFLNGPVPSELQVCHTCDNRRCVNPAHLWLGTRSDNMRDMSAKGRHWLQVRTHCPQGHERNDENAPRIEGTSRRRACMACARERALARYHATKTLKRDAMVNA